jgi:adenosylmethionine-8-amino-7-oxononanoate aminotransferase
MAPPALFNDGNFVEATTTAKNSNPKVKPSAVLHRSLHTSPHMIVAAEGLYVTLSNGQKILDATGGPAVSCIGHGHPRVKAAIVRQMEIASYCHSLLYSTGVAEELAEELCRGTGGEMTKVFIVSSGEFYSSYSSYPVFLKRWPNLSFL